MINNINIAWDVFLKKKSDVFPKIKNNIILTKKIQINVADQIKPVHILITGQTGSGKTLTAVLILCQSKYAMFLDPKGQVHDTLEELGEEKNWVFYKITDSPRVRTYVPFKLNVREFNTSILNVLAFKKSGGINLRVRNALYQFFKMKDNNPTKTYANFKKMCNTSSLKLVFEELAPILSETDEGISILELMKQRSVLDLAGFDSDSKALPCIVRQILNYRQENWSITRDKFFFGCDEAQDYARGNSAMGYAMGMVFSQGRSFNMVGVICANVIGRLNPNIKNNAFIMLIFDTSFDKKRYYDLYNIDLTDESIEGKMEEIKEENEYGNCVYHNRHTGQSIPIHVDMNYYKWVRENKDKPIRVRLETLGNNYLKAI